MILECYTCKTELDINEELKPTTGEQSFNFICLNCGWKNRVRILIHSIHASAETVSNESK